MYNFLPLIVLSFLMGITPAAADNEIQEALVAVYEEFSTEYKIATAELIKQTKCLASVVYHEARGESLHGQIAVAQVVINRKKSGYYPTTACAVAFQKAQFTGLNKIKYNEESYRVAVNAMNGDYSDQLKGATHFHTVNVNPRWARGNKMKRVGRVGSHIFYRMMV